MITLKNDLLTVKINKFGAELNSVVDRKSDYEFVWQADDNYWGRHAPVLFPIVGRLKEDKYEYMGKTYEMTQHGFARDSMFQLEEQNTNSAVFSLTYNDETLKIYPFEFKVLIKYLLEGSKLKIEYEVANLSTTEVMYYSIGGHPAFNVSQTKDQGTTLELKGVFLEIHPDTDYKKIPISEEGLTQLHRSKQVSAARKRLAHETFKNDALVYEVEKDSEIVLQDENENVEIKIKPNQMDYFGVWSPYPKRAGFICLEPWTGIADSEKTTGELTEKEGVSFLDTNESKTHDYTIDFLKN